MKWIKYISCLLFVLATVYSCSKTDEYGFLIVEGAGYRPDSLNMREELDPVLDAKRIAKKTPWFSTSIQGVDGTSPITYSLAEVTTQDGDSQSIFDNVEFKGDGIIYIPFENTVKKGRYELSIQVSNINGDKLIPDAFTLIIE